MRRAALALLVVACGGPPRPEITTLRPDPNPMTEADPLWSPQPHRDRPRAICAAGDKAWVMLAGIEDDPGEHVAVVDLRAERVLRRMRLAPSPWACAVDPTGRWVVVTLRYSDHAVVLDARSDAEVARVKVPFYTEQVAFHPAGGRVYLTNRWKDAVLTWDVATAGDFRVLRTSYDGVPLEDPMGAPVADNPTSMVLSPAGDRLFVGSATAVSTTVLDGTTLERLGELRGPSPVGGLAVWGNRLFVADVGRGTGSHAFLGRDHDGDGQAGDGTANVIFQDLQNEIAVVDVETLEEVHRYTSDSICCRDFRDVDPDLPERGLLLPDPDTWRPDVLAYLPPKETWIVAGALPEAMVVEGDVLWVAFAGSSEVQTFAIGEGGALAPRQAAGGLYRTGFNPKALVVAPGGGVVSVDRLGESLTFLDAAGPGAERRVVVGDEAAGPFPQTDAELGEAINEMTAAFTIDGDQTCVHCHRENAAIARPIVMPLQQDRLWGARNVMAQRGLFDTRPWFFESAMDEENFFPVLNEFARVENFCCEGLDPTVWSRYPSFGDCAADPSRPGCNHVLDCEADPPPECAARPYARVPFPTRGEFIKDAARRLFGRDTTFGDALRDAEGRPLPLDFQGITRAIGLFMLRTPRLLPNPNRWLALPTAARGAQLYAEPGVGCARCHPLPITTTAEDPVPFSPAGLPVRFPPVITPTQSDAHSDATRVTSGFIMTFPRTLQGDEGLRIGATPLRGIWDRPRSFFHDGRARSLREALSTPGHPALRAGEVGFNERDGTRDTHGGTSQLDRYQLEDLINFLETL